MDVIRVKKKPSDNQLATELNKNDRRILDKYSKFYTNFIESNTAQNDVLDTEFSPEKR
ncbi:MAG: hypothetical protein N2645_02510 [Clostridia bacterium]|nr:hypothetical protein [Clostridia bacterium]